MAENFEEGAVKKEAVMKRNASLDDVQKFLTSPLPQK